MKSTLLFATLSMVVASPVTVAKSELESLRTLCLEQKRQIQDLEATNDRLRSGDRPAAASPAAEAPQATGATYTVKAGDSLERIARKTHTSASALAKANGLKVSSIIRPGQKLKIQGRQTTPAGATATAPRSGVKSHKVQAGETLFSISKKHGMSTEALAAANPQVKPSALRPGQFVSLSGNPPATSMISAPAPQTKAPTPAPRESTPVATATAAVPAPAPVHEPAPAAAPEKKVRPITIDSEMTYGQFATQHGTDAERLNALNGLDLTTATILAKGSELYVPAQP